MVYAYIRLGTALFPTKINLWFIILVLHLGLVKGKALKNLSDYPPLGGYVTSLGKLAELGIVWLTLICMFSDIMSEFYCNCSAYMCLNHPVRTCCPRAQCRRVRRFLILYGRLHKYVCDVSVLTHKVCIHQMLSSCHDGMPIGNQRYSTEHVSIED